MKRGGLGTPTLDNRPTRGKAWPAGADPRTWPMTWSASWQAWASSALNSIRSRRQSRSSAAMARMATRAARSPGRAGNGAVRWWAGTLALHFRSPMAGFREEAVTVFMKMKPRVNQRRPGPASRIEQDARREGTFRTAFLNCCKRRVGEAWKASPGSDAPTPRHRAPDLPRRAHHVGPRAGGIGFRGIPPDDGGALAHLALSPDLRPADFLAGWLEAVFSRAACHTPAPAGPGPGAAEPEVPGRRRNGSDQAGRAGPDPRPQFWHHGHRRLDAPDRGLLADAPGLAKAPGVLRAGRASTLCPPRFA